MKYTSFLMRRTYLFLIAFAIVSSPISASNLTAKSAKSAKSAKLAQLKLNKVVDKIDKLNNKIKEIPELTEKTKNHLKSAKEFSLGMTNTREAREWTASMLITAANYGVPAIAAGIITALAIKSYYNQVSIRNLEWTIEYVKAMSLTESKDLQNLLTRAFTKAI